jgi:hypothetical protein
MTRIWQLTTPLAREGAAKAIREAPEGSIVRLGDPTRTLAQNAAQWPILEAFARQVEIDIGKGKQLIEAEDWKDILTATFQGDFNRVARWEGRFIILGVRTRKQTTKWFSDWLEFLNAAAVEHGVDLSWHPDDDR